MKFAVALGKSPGYGPDKTRRTYNFLPKHDMEYDLNAIEKKIVHKLEDRCEVRGDQEPQARSTSDARLLHIHVELFSSETVHILKHFVVYYPELYSWSRYVEAVAS